MPRSIAGEDSSGNQRTLRTNTSGQLQIELTTDSTGDATAANQALQITQETAINTVLGTTADAAATAGAAGSVIALLRALSRDLIANIVLKAGSAIIGKVGIDQTTPGTTDSVTVATAQGAGATIGTTSGAAVITDANGTIQQYLRGLVKLWIAGLAAGEAHVGEVGGNSTTITPTATVSTSPAYTAGDDVGGLLTLTSALRAAGHNVVLQNIMILDRANQKPTGSIFIFNANPAAATITDNAAFVFSTDDQKVVARIPVTSSDWVAFNSKAVADLPNLGRVITAASGTTLYAVFVTDSTPTFAATTDLQIAFSLLRD